MKPGYKTTEFWLSLLATLLGALAASGALGDHWSSKVVGLAVAGLAQLGYTASRGAAKKAAELGKAISPPT